MSQSKRWKIRHLQVGDVPKLQSLCKKVYPFVNPWNVAQLESHLKIFPNGQAVAEDLANQEIIGYSASLVLNWDDYSLDDSWKDLTDGGFFTNHDPLHGRTLYGAEVMVDPDWQGSGVGSDLYAARRALVEQLNLLRIRAGARLRGYHQYKEKMSAKEYLYKVATGEIRDPTVSFQIKRGFSVLKLVSGYLAVDPESLGYAAVIEWLNPKIATQEHYEKQKGTFYKNFSEFTLST